MAINDEPIRALDFAALTPETFNTLLLLHKRELHIRLYHGKLPQGGECIRLSSEIAFNTLPWQQHLQPMPRRLYQRHAKDSSINF